MENKTASNPVRALKKTQRLVMASVFTALIVVMAFTPLGYLKTGVVEITFLTIPVCIGAILLGEYYGLYFGLLFGLTSFVQCFGLSDFGAFMLNENAFCAFVTCVVTRMLVGYLTGLVFKLMSKVDKKGIISFIVSAISASFFNTVLFVGSFILFYSSTAYKLGEGYESISMIITTLITLNSLIELAVCATIGVIISKTAVMLIKRGIH